MLTCIEAIQAKMGRGGRRETSYKPAWKHGKTQTIRVPIDLAEEILAFAKERDEGVTQAKDEEIRQLKEKLAELIILCLEMRRELDSKKLDQSGIILTALKSYIEVQQSSPGGNQHRRKNEPLNIEESRDWKHFVKFMKEIEEGIDIHPAL